MTARFGGGDQAGVAVDLTHRSCSGAAGDCRILATSTGGEPGPAGFDVRAGTARVRHLVSMTAGPDADAPALVLDLRWQGTQPVGFHEVDRVSGPDQPDWSRERSGVRWTATACSGTVDGSPIGPVTRAVLSAYRERTVQAD